MNWIGLISFLLFFFYKIERESGARHGMSRIISSLER